MKLKFFSKHFLVNFLFILFSSSVVFSQYSQYVEPTNVQATADEIEDLFGNILNVSNADLVNAMQQMLTNFDANAGLVPPDPTILSIQNNYISFDWQDIPNAAQYQMSYLDVETGQMGGQSFLPGAAPHVLQVPNNLLMVMGNSSNSIGASRIRIDFVEADIIMRQGPCDCGEDTGGYAGEDWDIKTTAGIGIAGSLKNYFNTIASGTSFDLSFSVTEDDFDEASLFKVHGTKDDGVVYIEYDMGIGGNCYIPQFDIGVDGEATGVKTMLVLDPDAPGPDPVILGSFVLTASFDISLGGAMKMAINECQSHQKPNQNMQGKTGPNEVQPTAKLSPNPVKTHLNIDLPDANANGVKEIRVFSLSGLQVVHQQVNDLDRSLTISMAHLNAGIYLVELVTAESVEKRTIIKID